MSEYMRIFSKLAFILLAVWVVLAGVGATTMPGTKKHKAKRRAVTARYTGDVWAQPAMLATWPDAELAQPPAPVM